MRTKELETERLLLRKIEPDDCDVAYKEWCSDRGTSKVYYSWDT